jgi:hypothetical protein
MQRIASRGDSKVIPCPSQQLSEGWFSSNQLRSTGDQAWCQTAKQWQSSFSHHSAVLTPERSAFDTGANLSNETYEQSYSSIPVDNCRFLPNGDLCRFGSESIGTFA